MSMPVLVKELGIEGLASLNALVPSLVDQLVAEGQLGGWLGGLGGRVVGWVVTSVHRVCCAVLFRTCCC